MSQASGNGNGKDKKSWDDCPNRIGYTKTKKNGYIKETDMGYSRDMCNLCKKRVDKANEKWVYLQRCKNKLSPSDIGWVHYKCYKNYLKELSICARITINNIKFLLFVFVYNR